MVGIVNDEIHARETDYLVKLVPALVDVPVLRHESTYLFSLLLYRLGQIP
ncbi:hypothetical protein SDC9_206318 [bioreactor metagenome]|uniref:Uncharacterized protein n=1 Tax=bioreactor metagenome TaxID=1076179 RepID=A0A645J4P1_9ZZZZ